MSTVNVICRILSLVFLLATFGAPALITLASSAVAASGAVSAIGGVFLALPVGLFCALLSVALWWMGNVHDYLRTLAHDG